jgi:hypothetical protein
VNNVSYSRYREAKPYPDFSEDKEKRDRKLSGDKETQDDKEKKESSDVQSKNVSKAPPKKK